ncbi:MAG: UDP-N-acetylmuramate dehydrogenase [candidate division WOR-3 bacterium]
MRNIFKGISGIKVLAHESLKKHTSFRIGGKAKYFVKIYHHKALLEVMRVIKKNSLKYLIIGAGTNILFRDQGFDGAVLKLMGEFRKVKNCKNRFFCGAGVLIRDFIINATKSGYGGVEFLAGIPGSIGGAVKGNAGAFGHSISEVVKRVMIIDSKFVNRIIPRNKLIFEYRSCNIPEKAVITAVEINLKKSPKKMIERKIKQYLRIRWEKQPKGFSAGSFFKNPLPWSAGQLIEECGLKGTRIGGATVSRKHANFIINSDNAKAQDVIKLMNVIKKRVKKIKGIDLEPEVRII